MRYFEVIEEGLTISTNPALLNVSSIHDYLSHHTHWAKNRSLETVRKSIDESLCFGVYLQNTQIGFARVITDFAVFAFVLDVFVVDRYQGLGIGKSLFQAIMDHPDLQGGLVWTLATKDAHGLYQKYGFTELSDPLLWMQLDKRQ